MKNNFKNNYESTMICPACGRTGTIRCNEHVEIEFESDINASLQYIYPTTSNTVICNRCNTYMIRCGNDNELELMKAIVDLGFALESYSSGRIFSETISINPDTGTREVETHYVNPILSLFIPTNDPKRCIRIIEKAKSFFSTDDNIKCEFYAEFDDDLEECDHEYYSIDDILNSLNRGDVEFYCIELNIYFGDISGAITDREGAFSNFITSCLNLMNSFKELDT